MEGRLCYTTLKLNFWSKGKGEVSLAWSKAHDAHGTEGDKIIGLGEALEDATCSVVAVLYAQATCYIVFVGEEEGVGNNQAQVFADSFVWD